jgi:hypothetical protein
MAFLIKDDLRNLMTGEYFWCMACLVARPNFEKSADGRYCQACYEILNPPEPSPAPSPDEVGVCENGGDVVSKIPEYVPAPMQGNPIIMKQENKRPVGRPRKSGEISRTTLWRRKKEQQGELAL